MYRACYRVRYRTKGVGVSRNSSRHGEDRRTQRTRNALAEALMTLSPKIGFDALDVRALTRHARVGRSTFYTHYSDKDDFLITSYSGMVRMFDEAARERPDYRGVLPSRE